LLIVQEEAFEFLVLHGGFFADGQFLFIVDMGSGLALEMQFYFCCHFASPYSKLQRRLSFARGDFALGPLTISCPAAEVVDDAEWLWSALALGRLHD